MSVSGPEIVRKYDRLKARRAGFEPLWDDLAEFELPHRGRPSNLEQATYAPGERQTDRLFHSVAVEAASVLAANMQGALTSPTLPWFRLKTRDERVNEVKAVQDWLEHAEQRMLLAMRQSNFYAENMEKWFDLAVFGTGCLYIGERDAAGGDPWGGLLFRAHPVGSYVIDEGPDGLIDTIIRAQMMPARACVAQWEDKAGEALQALVNGNRGDQPVTILHSVAPRTDAAYGRQDSRNMPWASCYVHLESRHVLEEGGFRDFPYAVPRWAKTSGEMYGRGPGMIALPDVRTINKADESSLEAINLGIKPPLWAQNDGVVGEIDLRPFGVTVVEGGKDGLGALDLKGNYDMTHLFLPDREARIRRIFFWDQLQLPNEREMTYGEVERRLELMRRILGPTISRLEYEDLNVTVGRVFGIMLRRGQLGRPPDELSGADLDIEYEGPLAKSQRSGRLAAWQQTLSLISPLLQDPEMLAAFKENVNIDAAIRDIMLTAGAPSQWLADTRERDAKRKQRMQEQATQQALAQVEQVAGAAGAASPALKLLMGGAAEGQPAEEGAAA